MLELEAFPVSLAKANLNEPRFQKARDAWAPVIETFQDALRKTADEGNESSLQKHQDRGQLLGSNPTAMPHVCPLTHLSARDRVALLLDPDSPFLELCAFAGHGLEDSSPCASLISGIGVVSGKPCLILSHIPTLSGGAWNEYTVLKQNRVTEIATESKLPIIALVQSAGVFLPQQFRVFHKGGQIFRDLAVRTQRGLQSCAIVFGSSTAGGAYHPALSDHTIFVSGQAQVFLGGPPLVKMATGEVIAAEELGGSNVHGRVTGLADQVAIDEFDALRKARQWMASLPTPSARGPSPLPPLPPRHPADDLLALVDPDIRKPFDMREVLSRIVDDSRLQELKPQYGANLVTSWARIGGHLVGIIANQTPVINADEATKGAQFIRLCNQRSVPIVFLHNVTGFMVGSKAEHEGIIKKGAQLVSAVSCSTVPHISIIMGASYGAGNYAMCGRAYKPRFLFTWPTGRCSVMGPDQLSGVMEQVATNSAKAKGKLLNTDELVRRKSRFRDRVERDSECYRTSAAVLDDGVIDPRDTRDVLGMCLDVVTLQPLSGSPGHQTLARM